MAARGKSWAALAAIALWLFGGAAVAQDEAPRAEAAAEMPDTWYAQVLAHSDAGINVTHFWSKGRNLRAETVMAGRRIVTIVTPETYYAYDLLVRTGVAIQRAARSVAQDAERKRPFGNEYFSLIRQGAELVRTETLGGRTVEIYQLTNDDGRRRIWVPPDDERLPLRLQIFRRATAQDFLTDYLNWQRGLPIVDEFFRPEPGISILILTYKEYVDKQAAREPIGPVPVLYGDLLHGY
jgi:hypothetical protein